MKPQNWKNDFLTFKRRKQGFRVFQSKAFFREDNLKKNDKWSILKCLFYAPYFLSKCLPFTTIFYHYNPNLPVESQYLKLCILTYPKCPFAYSFYWKRFVEFRESHVLKRLACKYSAFVKRSYNWSVIQTVTRIYTTHDVMMLAT